jgi:hypothetical protein
VRQKLDNGGTTNRMHENGAGTSLSLGSDSNSNGNLDKVIWCRL